MSTTATDQRLRERAWHVLTRAKKPLTVAEVAKRAELTAGGALTYLREWTTGPDAGVVVLPATGHSAPYLDRYATPALLARLGLTHPTPDRSTSVTPTPRSIPSSVPAEITGAPGPDDPVRPVPYRVLVTGSRSWHRDSLIVDALDSVHAEHPDALVIVHGGCPTGADAIADRWARQHDIPVQIHPADWNTHGQRAGILRNTAMIQAGADLCLAFIQDASPGATHCAATAEKAGITVRRCLHTTARGRGAAGTARRDTLVNAALGYAERGWHIFPLRPDDKRPAFPNHLETSCSGTDPRCARAGRHVSWQERATTDPARIRTAWTSAPYGIGIACGPSDLVVIDLDIPKPGPDGRIPEPPPDWAGPGVRDGIDVFTLLCERAGKPLLLGTTYTVHTARKGLHLYFTHPTWPELRNTQGDLGWLIDTRAHGGYVVAPPSTANGLPYMVEDDTAPVAPLPNWLAETLTPAPLPAQEPVNVRLSGIGDQRRRRYLQAAIARCVDAVRASEDTKHNKALYGAAVQLGQLIAGGELTEADVITALLPAGIAVGQPETQARKTIASGLKAGANRPRTITHRAEGTAA